MPANIVKRLRANRLRILPRRRNQVIGQDVLHQLQRLVEEKLLFDAGMLLLHRSIAPRQDVDVLADVTDLQQPRLDAIVEVRSQIGNLVGKIDQLRLQRRPLDPAGTRPAPDARPTL